MCDICNFFFCPPSCPSYDGQDAEFGTRLGYCGGCGREIHTENDFFTAGSYLLCAACYDKLQTYDKGIKYFEYLILRDKDAVHDS